MRPAFEPIAIVGQSCVLPGALDPDQLWTAVADGRDLTSPAPAGRWGLPRHLAVAGTAERSADQAWSDRGGYVQGFDEIFDAHGFDLPAAEILKLDPLFQWVLHTGRAALRDAGLGAETAARTGIVLGNLSFPSVGASRFAESVWQGHRENGDRPAVDARNHFMSGLPAHLLAAGLGLGGTAFALDAACASSLVAIKLACDRLHDRRADVMLAGAVSCADDLFIHIGFCALEALSPTGRSRPFHARADGLLPAEGAAFVALRRLSDAVAGGDRILGVIRGIGLSNDGRGGGLLAPSEEGQQRAIRQAYEQAGLAPEDVSLVECHATGTRVGDAAEIHSLGRLYQGLTDVPIGSLKSNLGHLITAAGLAGLLKVLAAMKAGVRPQTLHTNPPHRALEGSPFRLLKSSEPWPEDGPRRAAISAFGFGGNNAHLLVEEWRPQEPASAVVAASEPGAGSAPTHATPPIAIVGLAVAAASDAETGAFAHTLFTGDSRLRRREDGTPAGLADSIELPLEGLGFPPNDLQQTLPQQLLLLATVRQAAASLRSELPRERTSVLVGMRCDAEIARYGLRWRLAGKNQEPAWLERARDAVVPELEAAGVVGTMPNMTANRINSLFDLGGPSASVSSEELSGLVALDLAARALAAGEIDAAVVCAADLACEPVHQTATRQLGLARIPGDAAAVLVLKRLEDARRDSDEVFALVERPERLSEAGTDGLRLAPDGVTAGGQRLDLTPRLGHAHAASSLLHVAAAALACHRRAIPAGSDGQRWPVPWLSRGPQTAQVTSNALSGRAATIRLQTDRGSRPGTLRPSGGFPRIFLYQGADRIDLLDRLRHGRAEVPAEGSASAPARLALVATDEHELAERREQARHRLSGEGEADRPGDRGVYLRSEPIDGELAFVFTGAGAAYHGMGRDLLLAMPELLDRLGSRMDDLPAAAGWVYRPCDEGPNHPLQQLWGSSFLSQVHAELSRGPLGLTPAAVLGYSSGESNSLMAMGAWNDLDGLYRDTVECGIFTHELGGDFAAVHRAWGGGGEWANWLLDAPAGRVREALASEDRVHLTLVSSPDDTAIGGESRACRRVIERLGAKAYPLGYDLAVHCPEVEEVAESWLELHRLPTTEVPGVRFYTHAEIDHYRPTRETAARAILGQAVRTLDFPALVKRAFDDGVRVFLEHGPRGLCSGWIGKILASHGVADGETLAVALDQAGPASLRRTAETVAQLLAAGVDVRWDVFHETPRPDRRDTGRALRFAAHWPPVVLPDSGSPLPLEEAPGVRPPIETIPAQAKDAAMTDVLEAQIMDPAPPLPPVLAEYDALAWTSQPEPGAMSPLVFRGGETPVPPDVPIPAAVGAPSITTSSLEAPPASSTVVLPAPDALAVTVLEGMSDLQARLAATQKDFLDRQAVLHHQFLALRQRTLAGLLLPFRAPGAPSAVAAVSQAPRPEASQAPPPAPTPEPTAEPMRAETPPIEPPPTRTPTAEPQRTPIPAASPEAAGLEDRSGTRLSRRDLEILASDKISTIFGPLFERQDGYARQTRMPEPPFLLADRVTGIDAEAGSMGLGTIWTETDVTDDSWYLHRRRMPGGLMIEAGQADLLLISWLGVDFLNRGERVYRLLGCELTYRGGLPRPGDTLEYDIHVDGHAQQGDVRLFFFHYDCRIDGEVRLEVRHGQAGFFTEGELAESAGVLWDPRAEAAPPPARVDPPRVRPSRDSFCREHLVAFSEGRLVDCMGPGFELALSHTLTPTIQDGRMLLLDRVTALDSAGGPWQRGYLRAATTLRPDSWIFKGHFKNDPCMPGTLMLEGCLQALSFYLAALGFTLEHDGWRFEPVPDETYSMRCRGQATPDSRELVYELFVHELIAGPRPTVFADLLCTVDGLRAFHARRLGLRLVPDWPLSMKPTLLSQPFPGGERPAGRPVARNDGFRFDYASLLACAWGRPSDAFGEMYRIFDGPRRVARLPGPPYHFMSRIASIDGEMGRFEPGAVLEAEYDVPPEEWVFAPGDHPTMPFAVLLEVGLQPCGWLASYIGSALTTGEDLKFRNLDGTGTLLAEVTPESGILKSRVRLLATSSSAGVLIVRFEVEMRDDHGDVYSMATAFGFFPATAMENQVGLLASDDERARLEQPSDFRVDLTSRPERYCSGSLALAGRRLLMLDRVTGWWPEGGKAGLGRLRAEKDVDPGEWFFKAHFFQDPVQPGSLGIEAMIQALQFAMIHAGTGDGVPEARFESPATGRPLTWKYRGQVLPTNRLITTELEITETGTDDKGAYAVADAWLWVDGKRIYSATNLGMRIVPGTPTAPAKAMQAGTSRCSATGQREAISDSGSAPSGLRQNSLPSDVQPPLVLREPSRRLRPALPADQRLRREKYLPAADSRDSIAPSRIVEGEEILDPEHDSWILDHCPTWTLPALPMMSIVDRLAAAAQARRGDMRVVGLEDVKMERWVAFPGGPLRLRTEVVSEERQGSEMGAVDVRLSVWRDAATAALSRFEVAATGRVLMARSFCPPPQPIPPLEVSVAVPDPYNAGTLFHGPAFQLLRELRMSDAGSTAVLDAAAGSVPPGLLHPALLDAATHGIPHDALSRWCAEVPDDLIAYPRRLSEARFYGPAPAEGEILCEARIERYEPEAREVIFHLQLLIAQTPWADLRLHEVLLPKGPLGSATPDARRAFLRDRVAVQPDPESSRPGLGLSRSEAGRTHLAEAEVAMSDWLPGTVSRVYGVAAPASDRGAVTLEVAIKDHVARQVGTHPSRITVTMDPSKPNAASGVPATVPLTRFPVRLRHNGDGDLVVTDAGPPVTDLEPLRRFWAETLGIRDWPVEDVYYGLIERFMRRLVVTDPDGLRALHGRSTLFLANHQVGIESVLFAIVASALVGTPTMALAKAEHRTSWLGRLIAHCFSYPGVKDPQVITFFERENMRSLPLIIRQLGERMRTEARSVLVHCEGTRSLTCRKPVTALSGSFVDMATKAGAAIVPVRFIGGLPAEPLAERLEFPLGHGQQDYWLGSPLLPEKLEAMRYKERRQAVMEAINGLGPSSGEEEPLQGNSELAAEVEDWIARSGASQEHATLYKTLENLEHPGREVRLLIEAAGSGRFLTPDNKAGRWLAELARRLFGDRGPKIVSTEDTGE